MNTVKEIPVKYQVLPTSFVGLTDRQKNTVLYTNFNVN